VNENAPGPYGYQTTHIIEENWSQRVLSCGTSLDFVSGCLRSRPRSDSYQTKTPIYFWHEQTPHRHCFSRGPSARFPLSSTTSCRLVDPINTDMNAPKALYRSGKCAKLISLNDYTECEMCRQTQYCSENCETADLYVPDPCP
jgi:hypothetical protein